jgi:hypothetical protein
MKQELGLKNFSVLVVGVVASVMLAGGVARAQYLYKWDDQPAAERFNNSADVETEDNWVANGFQVVPAGTRLLNVEYQLGNDFTNQNVWVIIYQGCSIDDACACGGLVELQRLLTNISGTQGQTVTIPLTTPINLNVGDVFYAALLIRNVTGDVFPFFNDLAVPHGHSFFDVGYYQGGPYDLDVQHFSIKRNGEIHQVVGFAQDPGNTVLRVNATTAP